MKILFSAYACEPGKGSEPGVGWNWGRQITRFVSLGYHPSKQPPAYRAGPGKGASAQCALGLFWSALLGVVLEEGSAEAHLYIISGRSEPIASASASTSR